MANYGNSIFKSIIKKSFVLFLAFVAVLSVTAVLSLNKDVRNFLAGLILPTEPNHYAYAENIGWIDFNPAGGNTQVTDAGLTGYAWSENAGWIRLDGVTNDGHGILGGYAYGENIGWINFDGVTIDSSGNFSGYAWGENTGWISFNCSNTSSCASQGGYDYIVATDWREQSAEEEDEGGGGGSPSGGGSFTPSAVSAIEIITVPNPPALSAESGSVVYNYTVQNTTGQQALIDITVTDDNCSPVDFLSGDSNSNAKLDPGESWEYSCTATLSATTTSTATATGYIDDASRQAVTATADTTVVVSAPETVPPVDVVNPPDTPDTPDTQNPLFVPGLPKTGLSPLDDAAFPSEKTDSGLPIRLRIPNINVDAAINPVGITPEGAVGAPEGPADAAWFDLWPRPGENGNAIITGHYGRWKDGRESVFADLNKLSPGDKIYVEDENGNAVAFVVRELRIYDSKASVPEVFYSSDGKAHLNLITCAGAWIKSQKTYPSRLVVFTDKE